MCRRDADMASSRSSSQDARRACTGMPHEQSLLCYFYSPVMCTPTPDRRLSLLRRAADVDVLLLQELKMSEREALSFTVSAGFQGIAKKARNPNGGGVAMLVKRYAAAAFA